MPDKKILFIVNITWDELCAKGVSDMIFERDEGGYFSHIYTAHFPALSDQIFSPRAHHTIIEFRGKSRAGRFGGFGLPYLKLAARLPIVVWRLVWLVNRENIEIVRSVDPFHTSIIGWLVARMTGRPFAISLHADHDIRFELNRRSGFILWILRRMRCFSLRHADMVMPIRESLATQAIKYGADPAKIRIIPHGIDLALFHDHPGDDVAEKLGAGGQKLIVFAARLRSENFIDDLVPIAKRVVASCNDVKFVIIGSGYEEERLKRSIKESGLDDYFIFLGFLPRETVIRFRQAAAVNLCLMGGFSLLEAAYSARPVIAYDVEWHYEVIENNVTGLLAPLRDITAVASGIVALLSDEECAKALGARARARVAEKYSLAAASSVKIQCYEELMAYRSSRESIERDKWRTAGHVSASSQPHMWRLFRDRTRFMADAISRYVEKTAHGTTVDLLDAGCGDGAVMAALFGRKNVRFFGVEYNPIRVDRIRRAIPRAMIVRGSVSDLCFKKGSFDIIILNHVLEHIRDDDRVLSEVYDALRPGGLLIFGTPNEGCRLAQVRNKYLQPSIGRTTDHVHFYTEGMLMNKLKSRNFIVRDIRREGFFVPHYSVWAGLASTAAGYALLNCLGRIFPSQSCGFAFVCEKGAARCSTS